MTHKIQFYNKIEYCIFSLETYTLTETRKKVVLNYKRWTGNMKQTWSVDDDIQYILLHYSRLIIHSHQRSFHGIKQRNKTPRALNSYVLTNSLCRDTKPRKVNRDRKENGYSNIIYRRISTHILQTGRMVALFKIYIIQYKISK